MRLIDADKIMYEIYADGDFTASSMKVSKADIDRMQVIDAIPVDWLKKQYPTYSTYSGDAYRQKAKLVREIIKEYEYDRQIHGIIEGIDHERK